MKDCAFYNDGDEYYPDCKSEAVDKAIKKLEEDECIGGHIIRRCLEEPLRQIAKNAGVEGAIVAERVKS